jgi:hypothetical protein
MADWTGVHDYEAARVSLAAARSALDVAGLPRITRLDRELSRLLLREEPPAVACKS